MRVKSVFFVLLATLLAQSAAAQEKWVILSEVARSNIGFLFDNLKVEFAFCAYGHEEADAVHVERLTLPIILGAGPNGVEHKRCHGRGLLGSGHGHYNPNDCTLSRVDRGNAVITGTKYNFLVCTGSRIKVFSKRDVEDSFTPQELKELKGAAQFLFLAGKNPPR